jgi:hypothetical protein
VNREVHGARANKTSNKITWVAPLILGVLFGVVYLFGLLA